MMRKTEIREHSKFKESSCLTNCVICQKNTLVTVIDLGFHPLADTFLIKELAFSQLSLYPLRCLLCTTCGHLQNDYLVSQQERYINNEYSYTSSNSIISRQHWTEFALTVAQNINLKKDNHVIEFGSNDGYLLGQFVKQGLLVSGIDPSGTIAKIARKNGIFTFSGFVGKESLNACIKRHGKATLIVGNNVFNHIENLNEVSEVICSSLNKNSYFVCEFPYLKDMIENYFFDLIYHEHISYFSIRAVDTLFKKHGLYIARIEHNSYHGGSVRVYSTNNKSKYDSKLVKKYVDIESKANLFLPTTYEKFMHKITQDKYTILSQIYSLKKKGKKISAVGAGARGNTLLNFYKLDNSAIDFVTDNSPHKIGKFTPFSKIPIVNDAFLTPQNSDVTLILSWNIGKYLIDKIRKTNSKIRFIVPGEKKLL